MIILIIITYVAILDHTDFSIFISVNLFGILRMHLEVTYLVYTRYAGIYS